MSSYPIAVGLASFGMSGQIFHAPFLEKNPNFRLKSILERSKSLSQAPYPNALIVRDFDALLSDSEIELIIINTPSGLHYEMAKAVLLAGKHVVIEKPFTNTSQEAEELIELAESKNLALTVYHNKRLEGDFKTIKKLITENRLGEIKKFNNTVHRYRPDIGKKAWKENDLPAAGLLYDFGAHLIDQVLILFGWPLDIEVDLQIQRNEGKVIDYFCITFKYEKINATILSDMLTKEGKPTYQIEGTKGSFIKYGLDVQEANLAESNINWNSLGLNLTKNYGTFNPIDSSTKEVIRTEDGSYIDFYQNVFEAIRQDEPLLVKPKEALDVIRMIEWVLEKGNS